MRLKVDISESQRLFKANYNLEFCPDGTIFGTQGKQLICGGWSKDNNSINFMLTWHGNCYQYNGTFDTILNEISENGIIKMNKKELMALNMVHLNIHINTSVN